LHGSVLSGASSGAGRGLWVVSCVRVVFAVVFGVCGSVASDDGVVEVVYRGGGGWWDFGWTVGGGWAWGVPWGVLDIGEGMGVGCGG
jgi:hypothetical protein